MVRTIHLRLWQKIVLLMASAMLLLALGLVLATWFSLGQARQRIGFEGQKILANQIEIFLADLMTGQATALDLQLDQAQSSAIYGALFLSEQSFPSESQIKNLLPSLLDRATNSTSVYYIDPSNTVWTYAAAGHTVLSPETLDLAHQPFFPALETGSSDRPQVIWSQVHRNILGGDGGIVVDAVAPVVKGGQIQGYVGISVSLDQIITSLNAQHPTQGSYVFLVDASGRLVGGASKALADLGLVNTSIPAPLAIQELGDTPHLANVLTQMIAGQTRVDTVNLNDELKYLAYQPLQEIDWRLGRVVPLAEATGASTQLVQVVETGTQQALAGMVVLGGLMLAIALVGVGSMVRRHLAPMVALATVADEIAGGSLERRVEISSEDEIGEMAHAFNSMADQVQHLISDLERRVANRTSDLERRSIQLQVAAEVARDATSASDWQSLIDRAVNLVRDRFGFYHAGLFLVDDLREYAVLVAATGEAGQVMLERGHKLRVGEVGIVGYVTGTGRPRIALDVGSDAVHFKNPVLPETRSEMALPMRVGDQIIGALDVQSRQEAAFDEESVTVLQTMADQLAIAIANARAYEQLHATAEKLRELDELKSQFIANMSHELRTPLNSIIGFSKVILKGIDGPVTDLQKKDLTVILNAGQHLLTLIGDILDISKIEAGKMELDFETVDLERVIEGALSAAAGLVKEKNIRLEKEINNPVPTIRADTTRLRQILLNLLSNAAKFTETGEIRLRAQLVGDTVWISVIDTGPGIPEDKLNNLFQAFYQVDGSATRKVGGTGLGLAISRHFVEMHGGRIWVESVVGQGTTFSFTLPINGPDAEAPLPNTGRAPTALVVDHDLTTTGRYTQYLEREGYQVIVSHNGLRVLDLAIQQRPAVILLDVQLPARDGWQVLADLKQHAATRSIPVIMCGTPPDDGRAQTEGASGYLAKPVDRNELLTLLTTLTQLAPKLQPTPA